MDSLILVHRFNQTSPEVFQIFRQFLPTKSLREHSNQTEERGSSGGPGFVSISPDSSSSDVTTLQHSRIVLSGIFGHGNEVKTYCKQPRFESSLGHRGWKTFCLGARRKCGYASALHGSHTIYPYLQQDGGSQRSYLQTSIGSDGVNQPASKLHLHRTYFLVDLLLSIKTGTANKHRITVLLLCAICLVVNSKRTKNSAMTTHV